MVATGNEWVSLPDISPEMAAIGSFQVLSGRALGLLGVAGEDQPLLAAFLEIDGSPALVAGQGLTRVGRPHDWWVEASGDVGPVTLHAKVFAPIGHRGFVVRLTVERPAGKADSGSERVFVRFGLDIRWDVLCYTLFRTRPMPATLRATYDKWTRSVVMEATNGLPVLGWAVGMAEAMGLPEQAELLESGQLASTSPSFRMGRSVSLAPGERASATFFVSVAPEGDGARTTNVDMRRRGFDALVEESAGWLMARRRSTDSPAVDERINLNLLTTFFFGAGRTLEEGEWVAVTSRSPRYYVSAAFWARDTLLWSFPA
ncbi:MAG: hypothetical protein IMX02_06805 [Limnochordaceae bacterium]|nr:hypothetical protein [Limnochordaceae bacterium]